MFQIVFFEALKITKKDRYCGTSLDKARGVLPGHCFFMLLLALVIYRVHLFVFMSKVSNGKHVICFKGLHPLLSYVNLKFVILVLIFAITLVVLYY